MLSLSLSNQVCRIRNDSALLPADTSLSLISLPDDLHQHITHKPGFRRVVSKVEASSSDLQANQVGEVANNWIYYCCNIYA